jgi:hypothetical protein
MINTITINGRTVIPKLETKKKPKNKIRFFLKKGVINFEFDK